MNWIRKPAKRVIHGRGGNRKKAPITLATSKVSKSEADYINYSRQKHCDDCIMFRPPGLCTKVAGDILMVGTCRLWEAILP